MKTLTFYLYRFLINPILLLATLTLGLFFKKIRLGLKLRFSRQFRPPYPMVAKSSQPVWFHCSSAEFEYARPIIRAIKDKNPLQKVLVTFFSPSHYKQILKDKNVDYCYPIPFDLAGPVLNFIDFFKPKKILFARTDIWPELLHQAQKKDIKTLLFSRTHTKPSFLGKWRFNKLSAISFAAKTDKDNFLAFNPQTTIDLYTDGDTRFDEVLFRKTQNKTIKSISTNGFCLVLGSIWPEDLDALLTNKFIEFVKSNNLKLIIAPHEFNPKIKASIDKLVGSTQTYSEIESWTGEQPLIIDQHGILFEIYQRANLSFIGGSFKSKVHSVMEPLAWGSPVAVGPKNKNNREAQIFKNLFIGRETQMVSEIKSDDELISLIRTIQKIDQNIPEVISAEVKKLSGATQNIVNWILS